MNKKFYKMAIKPAMFKVQNVGNQFYYTNRPVKE